VVEVGIRALRDRLSEFVERVRAGEALVVTDRGRAVARLVPMDHERALDRLIREGLVEPAPVSKRSRPTRRVPADGRVSDLIERR
jgi:prevent-host-death family protein